MWQEFTEGASEDAVHLAGSSDVIVRASVKNLQMVNALATFMDIGEAETLAIAVENQAALVLMDDLRGRKAAQRLGLRTRGVLGHLLLLKQQRIIESVADKIETLRQHGFYLADALVEEVLRAAGER
ncbi:MAG: DUF3368 domain-containing protein [Fimbriimonadales bacterium]|nr:DUF3368 domain-containing protein [Fimbriimonadales bacterium]MDW8107949.1 DUF3368 domain-containing protein [Armatimonadota bacterium]